MFNRLSLFIISIFFLFTAADAQTKAVLPFTGLKYFSEGISAKNITVKVDGAILLSNRIPLGKEFEISLNSPSGFTEDKSKVKFIAAELTVTNIKGEVIFKIPNMFPGNEAKGFAPGTVNDLAVKTTLRPDFMKADPLCTVKVRFYDMKGKNQLRVEFPVAIAKPGEMIQTTKLVNDIKTTAPTMARANVVKAKSVEVSVDTTIRVNPKMAYISLDISGIDGTSISEILSGKESYWVYDANDLSEIKMTDKQLKQVGGAMENNIVNYLSKVPFRLKTVTNKSYIVRFRWESQDKRKMIDIVVTK